MDTPLMVLSRRLKILALVGVVVALAVAIPVMGADPAPSASPHGQTKPDKAPKAAKGPEVAVTVRGSVNQTTDGKGRAAFTLTADGKTWELSAGPRWYWGDKNPLKAYVGKSVSVTGTYRAGGTDLDVETIDGTALRGGGRPPWAGGHHGKPGKGLGHTSAPGQAKDKTTDD